MTYERIKRHRRQRSVQADVSRARSCSERLLRVVVALEDMAIGRSLLRAEGAGRQGEKLDSDQPRGILVHLLPMLRPTQAIF